MIGQYKNVPLKFSSYYKYAFTFVGIAPDGKRIVAIVGGIPDDIYRYDVSADEIRYIGDDYKNEWNDISIYDDDKEIFNWNNR